MKKYLFYFNFFYRNFGSFLFTSRKLLFACCLISSFFYSQETPAENQSVITVFKGATIVSVDGGAIHVVESNDGISEDRTISLEEVTYPDENTIQAKQAIACNTKPEKIKEKKAIPEAKKSTKKIFKSNSSATNGECFIYSTTSKEFFSTTAGTSYNAVNTSSNNFLTLYIEQGNFFTAKIPIFFSKNNYYFLSKAHQQSFYKRWSVRPPPY